MYQFTNIPPWEFFQKSIPGSHLDPFSFDLPMLIKGTEATTGRRIIQGVASTPAKDLQDEEVMQKGMDLRYFLRFGYYNDDHKPGPENKVGQPLESLIKMVKDVDDNQVLGLWTRGFIWPKGAHRGADNIWELAKALEAAQSDRHMGFSIQGKILKREGKRILKAWIQDIAITASPVNTKTWMEVVEELTKSQWAVAQDLEDLREGINVNSFIDQPLIEEPWISEKALSAGSASAVQVESLEENNKLALCQRTGEDDIAKAINFAYRTLRKRGHSEEMSRGMAMAAVAKTLLQ